MMHMQGGDKHIQRSKNGGIQDAQLETRFTKQRQFRMNTNENTVEYYLKSTAGLNSGREELLLGFLDMTLVDRDRCAVGFDILGQ